MNACDPIPLTVALLTYNRLHYLREAVAGILAQTYRDFEFLILDNGSTDATPQYIIELDDPRVRYVRNPPGCGVVFNNASAYHIARGQRVIVTHDDDVMEPEMLDRLMTLMDARPEVALVWSNVCRIDDQGMKLEPEVQFGREARIFEPGAYIERFLIERLWPTPSAMMLERRLIAVPFANWHYFRTTKPKWKATISDLGGIADVTFPASINTRRSIAFLDEPLLRYRVHGAQSTQTVDPANPSIYLYRALRNYARRVRDRALDQHLFESHLLKHKLQKQLSLNTDAAITPATRRLVRRAVSIAYGAHDRSDASRAIASPVLLAARLGGTGLRSVVALPPNTLDVEVPTSIHAFLAWERMAARDESLFTGLPQQRAVIVFGTALVAALLVLDALRHGRRVLGCVDSNVHRHGDTLFGVAIHAPHWLAECADPTAIVVLSSEKDQETHLTRLVREEAGRECAVISWKQLAARTSAPREGGHP